MTIQADFHLTSRATPRATSSKWIGIITPAWKAPEGIRHTVKSIQSQKGVKILHKIVVPQDDQATINEAIKAGFDRKGFVFMEPAGIYPAMNAGVEAIVNHEKLALIGILNAGDTYTSPETLRTILGHSVKNEEADVFYGILNFVPAAGSEEVTRVFDPGEFNPGNIHFGWMPPHPTFYMTPQIVRKMLHLLGERMFREDLKIAADYEFFLRLVRNNANFHFIKEVLIYMEEGGASSSKRFDIFNEDVHALMLNGYSREVALAIAILKRGRKLPQFLLPRVKSFMGGLTNVNQSGKIS